MKEVVLITGCSTGIGRDMCNELSRRGYVVVATARNVSKLEQVEAALKLELDVTKETSIKKAVHTVIEQYGTIDILINNAGYSIRGALEEVPLEEMKKMFDVNVYGITRMVKTVVPIMRERKKGKIINIGSISGLFGQSINGGYCATKHAVEALTDALRQELYDYQIQTTVIEPGAMETDFFRSLQIKSASLMNRTDSPYARLYQKDTEYRKTQNRADSKKAVVKLCDIIQKPKLNARYQLVVPFLFKILVKLPDRVREWLLLHH